MNAERDMKRRELENDQLVRAVTCHSKSTNRVGMVNIEPRILTMIASNV
jgi:hypothetical protein